MITEQHKRTNNQIWKAKLRELVEAAKEKDKFDNMKEPGLPDSKERNDFLNARYWAWKRYIIALKVAEETAEEKLKASEKEISK